MANEEHLNILMQGVEAWNQWREQNPDIRPDLILAKLRDADLGGANLYDADLREAYLLDADLRGAVLSQASLRRADLSRANLSDADLRGTVLGGADLSKAYLSRAILIEVDFSGADLCGTNFEYSAMGSTILTNVDLCQAKNLDGVRHVGPSSIGIDTIYKSRGQIPEVFLRGCGVPDQFITYIGSLVGQPIQFYSCFISYSSKDQAFAERLHADLQAHNVRCWFAPHDLKIGERIIDGIEKAIRVHEKLLVVLSENAVQSDWVGTEVALAREKERECKRTVLFPIRLDDAVMQSNESWARLLRSDWNIGDFHAWKDHDAYQAAFERLLRDLKVE